MSKLIIFNLKTPDQKKIKIFLVLFSYEQAHNALSSTYNKR